MSQSGPDAPRTPIFVAVLALAGITVSLQQTLVVPLVPLVPLVPQFPRLLGAPAADTAWVVTSTLLTAAVATPVVGRLADMIGKRRMMIAAVAMLILGSVVAALSTSLVPLIVGRALQGLSTGLIPLGISLMRDHLRLQLPAATGYGLGESVLVAGLVLASGGLCMMAMSPVSARISAASGPRTTLMLGAVVIAAGSTPRSGSS